MFMETYLIRYFLDKEEAIWELLPNAFEFQFLNDNEIELDYNYSTIM